MEREEGFMHMGMTMKETLLAEEEMEQLMLGDH